MAQKEILDFSKVRDAGNFNPKRKTEGEYLGTIVSYEDTKSKSGNKMWVYGIQLKSDRRAVYPVYCVLDVKSLWKLRDLLLAVGVKVPKKKLNVDGNRIVGKDVGLFLEDDEYEGKPKSVITSFFPASEYDGDADGNDGNDSDQDEEAEEEEYEDETPADDVEDDSDEPEDEEEEEDEEPEPVKKAPAKKRTAPSRAKAKKAEPEDDEDEDEMDVEDL